METRFLSIPKNDCVLGRQIAFFAAFILPVYKFLELPSILSRFAGGDLLLPALLHYALQTGVLIALIFLISRLEKPLVEALKDKIGKWSVLLYALYGVYFLFAGVLPLLDLEKFVYAIFYDTSPTFFSFAFFFLFSAFVCARGLKALGRFADLSVFLFLIPFLALVTMSVAEADTTSLLPFFERGFGDTMYAFNYSSPHFSDIALLLPLLANLRYQKNDGKKIVGGYALGGAFTLLFLGVFYALYSSIAPREHYAFAKIAQYFPALTVIGRVDLLFVYLLCTLLFTFVATPLLYATDIAATLLGTKRRTLFSVILNGSAFVFVLFSNRHYDGFYRVFGRYLFPVFWIFSTLLPLALLLLLPKKRASLQEKRNKKENGYA